MIKISFDLRDRKKDNAFELKHAINLLNEALMRWSYMKLKKAEKQKKVRINKKLVDITPFELIIGGEINLFDYIKPYNPKGIMLEYKEIISVEKPTSVENEEISREVPDEEYKREIALKMKEYYNGENDPEKQREIWLEKTRINYK